MGHRGADHRQLEDVLPEVEKAATQAAIQVLGTGARDLIEDVVAEVYLQLVRVWPTDPPRNPAGWAFAVGANCAKRLGRKVSAHQQRHTELREDLVQPHQMPEESDEIATISVEAALEALDKLVALTNHMIYDLGADVDRKIFVLFHIRGQSWEEIAAAVNLSSTAVHRRYYRLIKRVAGVVRENAMRDPLLSGIFHGILADDRMFRCALVSLLNVVGRRGFPAIREMLESFLS